MKVQVLMVVMAVLSLSTTGCGTLRNCLFGRGAACGSCVARGPAAVVPAPAAVPYAQPCGPACGVPAPTYAGELGCGSERTCGSDGFSSYAPAMGGYVDGSYIDGGVIGNGITYPQGYVPGMPMEGGSWAPRGEYIVPGSSYPMESSTTMNPVNGG